MNPPRIDLLISNVRIVACTDDACAASPPGFVAISNGMIVGIGPIEQFDARAKVIDELDGHGALLTPGLIDCHTHLVYAGERAREFEMRLQGASYEDIARAGGGILSTVRNTRAAEPEELLTQSARRLQASMRHGVTTIEIKSGYGLSLADEIKCLQVARTLGKQLPVDVRTTLLAAHALPPEFAQRPDAWIDEIVQNILPEVARLKLADAVDAFCETIGFTPAQTRRVFKAARSHWLPIKLHAEQLSNQGGAALAAEFGGLSADHLEHVDEAGVRALAASGTVAVMLPGAYYFLRDTKAPPIALFREHGVAMAVATDCNPGTSPVLAPAMMMSMACTLFGLTPEEALAGMTREGARALGLQDEAGTISPGKTADLCVWRIGRPAELCYWIGMPGPERRIVAGEDV